MNFTYASNLRTFLSKRILSIFTILFQRNSIAKKKTGKPRKLFALREMIVHHMDGLQIQYFGLVEYSPTTINQKKSILKKKEKLEQAIVESSSDEDSDSEPDIQAVKKYVAKKKQKRKPPKRAPPPSTGHQTLVWSFSSSLALLCRFHQNHFR